MKISSVDCVTELLAYTYHLADRLQTDPVPFDQVSRIYHDLIGRAKNRARSAGIPKNRFDLALFPVFAWIDETILETGWSGRNEWIKNSLQKTFFNTTNAGVEFFERAQKLGDDDQDILEAYHYCLSSGFKGNLYESFQQERLEGIKSNIREKLKADKDFDLPEVLFPEAGDVVFTKRLKRKRWKGLSNYSSVYVLVPVVLLLLLYYFFNEKLTRMVIDSGLM